MASTAAVDHDLLSGSCMCVSRSNVSRLTGHLKEVKDRY